MPSVDRSKRVVYKEINSTIAILIYKNTVFLAIFLLSSMSVFPEVRGYMCRVAFLHRWRCHVVAVDVCEEGVVIVWCPEVSVFKLHLRLLLKDTLVVTVVVSAIRRDEPHL